MARSPASPDLIPPPYSSHVIPDWRRVKPSRESCGTARAPCEPGFGLHGLSRPRLCSDQPIFSRHPAFSNFCCKQRTFLKRRLPTPCVTLGWPLGGPCVTLWVTQSQSQSQTQSQPSAEGRRPKNTKRNGIPLRSLVRLYEVPRTKYQLPAHTHPSAVHHASHARTSSPAPVTALYDPLLNAGTYLW